jgi:hypothetical protein
VGSGLCLKLMSMFAGLVGSIIIVWTLSPDKQGIYYLFSSLIALRLLFELGVGTSVIQMTSFIRTKEEHKNDQFSPGFVATVNNWMLKVTSAYLLVAGVAGYLFISSKIGNQHSVLIAWFGFIFISALQFFSEGKWSILEGLDKICEVNQVRIKSNLILYVVQWSLLISGAELYSFCIAAASSYLIQERHLFSKYRWLYRIKDVDNCAVSLSYKVELFSLIKRASQTYLAGYFVFQVQQPICFYFLGSVAVAKLGFTYTIAYAILNLPVAWLAMNFPRISYLNANHNSAEARLLFLTKWKQSLIMTLLAFIGAIATILFLLQFPKFSDRIIDTQDAIVLMLSLVLQTVSMNLIYWPRSFKVEPFTRVAYLQMFATPVLFYYYVKYFGLAGACWANLTTWVIGSIGIAVIARKFWVKSKKYDADDHALAPLV